MRHFVFVSLMAFLVSCGKPENVTVVEAGADVQKRAQIAMIQAKPGDVIEIEGTYGWINSLRARYASVITRDGKEHLIPNEDLITNRVINWSFSDRNVRVRVPIGISYDSNPRLAIELCLQAAKLTSRTLMDPEPKCLLTGFGDNSIDLELRFWIDAAKRFCADFIN